MKQNNETDIVHDRPYFQIIGGDVLSYECIIPYSNTSLFIGDIIVVEDKLKGFRFYARIINMHQGFGNQSIGSSNKVQEAIGVDEVTKDKTLCSGTFLPYLRVEALAIGYIDASGRFFRPRTIPAPLSPVLLPTKVDFAFLQNLMGDLEIGFLKTGSEVYQDVTVRIPSPVLNQHMGVFATTGMGKSNFMKVFCASCIKKRSCGLLLIDPHGEYISGVPGLGINSRKGLIDCPDSDKGLVVYSIRTDSLPMSDTIRHLWLDYNDFRIEDLELLFALSSSQWEVIESLRNFTGGEILHFFLSRNVDELPTRQRLTTFIGDLEVVADKIKPFPIDVLRLIQRLILALLQANQKFFREEGSSVSEIITHLKENRVVLIDIPEMTEKSELFILSVLTRAILAEYKENSGDSQAIMGNTSSPQVLITIEEAQRVLSPGRSGQDLFREVAMEGRKFGVGLCVITQQPKNIDTRVLAQMNTFIVMGLADEQDRETIAGSAKHDLRRLDVEIQTLDRGDAIISSVGIPFPMSTRIHLFEEYISGDYSS